MHRQTVRSPTFLLRAYATVAALVILCIISFREDLLEAAEAQLATHMVFEHALFFLIGALSVLTGEVFLKLLVGERRRAGEPSLRSHAARLWSSALRNVLGSTRGLLWLGLAVGLMAFWHLPEVFDLATMYEDVHILQHLSFVAVGAAGFIATRVFGDSFRIILLVVIISMMGFAGLLFSVLDGPVYSVYSTADHNDAGGYMIVTSMVILIIGLPLYLIKKTLSYVRAMGRE